MWVKQYQDPGETFGSASPPVRAFRVDTVFVSRIYYIRIEHILYSSHAYTIFASSIYYIRLTHILYSPGVDTIGGKRKIILTLKMVLDIRGAHILFGRPKKSSPYFLSTCKPHQKTFTRESYKNCCNEKKKLKDCITESTGNTGENCRGLIYQALPTSNSPVGFDESNPYDRIYLTKVGHFSNRQNQN